MSFNKGNQINTTHGLSKHTLYGRWRNMIHRCTDYDNVKYHNYGGRGISFDPRWGDVAVFIEWCMDNGWKPGLELDRIDGNGDYSPDNCRLITHQENCCNKDGGIHWSKQNKKWKASVTTNGKRYHLGYFRNKGVAMEIRNAFIRQYYLPNKIQEE